MAEDRAAGTAAGARPHINDRVEGEGPPVTLIHGVGADLASWDAVAAALAPHFTVLRLDLRGHGASDPIRGEATLEDLAGDVRAMWDRHGIDRGHLVGFSLGGLLAQSLALSDPERIDRLVLLSTVAGRSLEDRTSAAARAEVVRERGIAAIAPTLLERWFTPEFRAAHPDRVQRRLDRLLGNDNHSYYIGYKIFATRDFADALPAIGSKTLVATGEHDIGTTVAMARLMQERIPGATLEILPGLRHSVLVQAPELVSAMLLRFLRGPA